jgi:1-phosphofructokinase family hexose kinase
VLIAGPNLTIDRTLTGGALRPGEVLRFAAAAGPGGKGLNVARGAQALGAPATLVAFLPGHTGRAVGAMIADEGIRLLGVPCGGEVRSTAVILEPGRSTVINEHGTEIGAGDWARYAERVAGALSRHAVLVCSGSLPPGAPPDAYARLTALAREHGVRCLVDAAGPAVRGALAAAPDLVTPNLAEAEAALGSGDGSEPVEVPPDARERALSAAAALVEGGARAAVVTAAAAGAALATGDGVLWLPAATVTVRNPIGAGDALLAGLAAALEDGEGLEPAVRAGIAAAGAAVEDPRPGRLDPGRAQELRVAAGRSA